LISFTKAAEKMTYKTNFGLYLDLQARRLDYCNK